jgi:putative heme-binding domain-containing protein
VGGLDSLRDESSRRPFLPKLFNNIYSLENAMPQLYQHARFVVRDISSQLKQAAARGIVLAVCLGAFVTSEVAQAADKQYASPVVTLKTAGHAISIELDITDAKVLYLEVTDGGDGTSYDWADWIEPKLVGPSGEVKLTDLKWSKVTGRATIGKNNGGGPLKVNGKPVAFGIGTHARSTIHYKLPKGYTKFSAKGGLDNGGTDQPGSKTSVQFRVYTSSDAHFEQPVSLAVPKGFAVQRIFSGSVAEIGSWVALGVDAKGRLITADRQGPLYRITLPSKGNKIKEAKVEKLPVEVGGANGLLQAFGSFFVVGKGRGKWNGKSGLFRLNDTNGDDNYDKVEFLIPLAVGGDHHAHAVILNPDKTRLMILCGNSTDPPGELARRNIQHQLEDHLLPRSTYYGHNTGRKAPGGFVITCKPDGTDRTLFCAGFRNPYDIALNSHGELFTFDADMEYDVGGPWYRPTRVNHSVSGGDYGWRWGAGKWPNWFPDTVPTTVDIGRGSPTGVVFGYGAKFPAKYQKAFFVCDWTYGRILAVHLKEQGATYTGEFEEFLTGQGNPASDIVIHPDGSLYFVTGGRRNPTSLYRVSYVGEESTAAVDLTPKETPEQKLRQLRRQLEAYHGKESIEGETLAVKMLSHPDRRIRFAARTVFEHKAGGSLRYLLQQSSPTALIEAAVAIARTGDKSLHADVLRRLTRLDFKALKLEQQLDLLRAYGLVFIRLGKPDADTAKHLSASLSDLYPANVLSLDHELCQMLLYINAPGAVSKTVQQLMNAETQSEQMFYAYHLRTIKDGWSNKDLTAYFEWMQRAKTRQGDYIGGGHFGNFLKMVDSETSKRLSAEQTQLVAAIRKKTDFKEPPVDLGPRKVVQKWTVADLKKHLSSAETGRSFIRGRLLYQGLCSKCHLFKGKGGAIGPDLTSTGKKLKPLALLTEIIEPSKVISDQHASVILILKNGKSLTGREVGGDKDTILLATNAEKPAEVTKVKRSDIELRKKSPISMMPVGGLDTLTPDEILDLMMYVSSGGNSGNRAFQQ